METILAVLIKIVACHAAPKKGGHSTVSSLLSVCYPRREDMEDGE